MDTTVGTWLDRALRTNAVRRAIEWDGGSLTYAEVDAWSRHLETGLRDHGVGPGDAVALFTGNRPEFIVGDIAIARLGAARVPVNQLLPPATVAYTLRHSRARAVLVGPEQAAAAAVALKEVGDDVAVWQVDDGGVPLLPQARPLHPPDTPASPVPMAGVPADAIAAILYTGGTTGRPKGVVHTQGSWLAFHTAQLIEAEIRQHERMLLMTPLAHAGGVFAQSAMLRGATVVLRDRFDTADTLHALEHEGITWTFLVPTMIYRLLDALGVAPGPVATGRFPQLDTIVYGAAPISPDRLGAALSVFGPVFLQLYGQTECPNWGTRLAKGDHDPARPDRLSSCGQASIGAEVKVVDDDGAELPAGDIGEVCVRAPYTLLRYHDDPEATAAKFLDDWIRTGDVGVLDDAGYLYLKDRRADMVVTGGMNVYCKEVEDVLAAHPAIRDVAVIGIPHDDWGEAVHAIIVADEHTDEADVLAWARDRVAAYARPKTVEFTAALPETPFGKIDKKALRARYWGDHARAIN